MISAVTRYPVSCMKNMVKSAEELEALNIEVAIAGRMMTHRIMGKASLPPYRTLRAVFRFTFP